MVWCWWQFIVDQHRISRSHRKESTVLSLAPKIEGSNSIGWAHIHGCYSTDDVCNKIEIAASVDACRREKVKKCRRVLAWRVETSDVFARPQLLHSNLTSCLSHNSVAPSDFLLWTSDTTCIMRLLHGGYSACSTYPVCSFKTHGDSWTPGWTVSAQEHGKRNQGHVVLQEHALGEV